MPQPGNPQSFNRYSYTLNNPQNYIDPSGFFFGKLFKAIGNFFKSIFRNPGVFFASLIVGIATGGVAAFAGAPAWLAAGLGGMAGAMTGAGMTGGNIWQAALIGGIAGGVGGWVGANAGPLAGALAGGATGGALNTAFKKGNFAVNVFSGAITAGIVYGAGKVISEAFSSDQTSQESPQQSQSETAGGFLQFAQNKREIQDTLSDADPVYSGSQRPKSGLEKGAEGISELVHKIEHYIGPTKPAASILALAGIRTVMQYYGTSGL